MSDTAQPVRQAVQEAWAWRWFLLAPRDALHLHRLPAAAAAGRPDAFGFQGAADLAPAVSLVAQLGDAGPGGLVVFGLAPSAFGEGGVSVLGAELSWVASGWPGCVVGHRWELRAGKVTERDVET